jgi:GNAT superfamily N-acetyltransferase
MTTTSKEKNNIDYVIREATRADFPVIIELIRELALYEKAPEKVTNSVEQMEQEADLFRCLMAENSNGEPLGMALWFYAYYTWVGKSLYLDDIYVREAFRGNGIGGALLERVFAAARAAGCKRVRWQVLDWNTPAIEVYKRYGADIDDQWLNCSFDQEGIEMFP